MGESLEEEPSAFIAVEICSKVIELVAQGFVIDRDSIVERLEKRRKSVGNVVHKRILSDAEEFVRKGM